MIFCSYIIYFIYTVLKIKPQKPDPYVHLSCFAGTLERNLIGEYASGYAVRSET